MEDMRKERKNTVSFAAHLVSLPSLDPYLLNYISSGSCNELAKWLKILYLLTYYISTLPIPKLSEQLTTPRNFLKTQNKNNPIEKNKNLNCIIKDT